MNIKKIITILTIGFVGLVYQDSALANIIGKNGDGDPVHCSPIYSDVKNVIVSFEHNTPYENANWGQALHWTDKIGRELFAHGDVNFEFQDSVNLEQLSQDTLAVKYHYSYAKGDSFSIPLSEGVLAAWLEVYRKAPKGSGNKILSQTLDLRLIKATEVNTLDPDILLSSAVSGFMSKLACSVLMLSSEKKCTNPMDHSKNRVVEGRPCVKETPQDDDVLKTYQQLEE